MIPLAIVAGYLAGLVVAVLAVAAENSRIALTLVSAATLWLVRSGRLMVTPLTAAFGIVTAALTALLFGAGLGVLSGGAVALSLERPARTTTIGIVVVVVLIVVGNAAFIPALFTP